jgi:hypothetical protein
MFADRCAEELVEMVLDVNEIRNAGFPKIDRIFSQLAKGTRMTCSRRPVGGTDVSHRDATTADFPEVYGAGALAPKAFGVVRRHRTNDFEIRKNCLDVLPRSL